MIIGQWINGRRVLGLLALLGCCASLNAQEDYSSELPRIPPTAPADALAKFHVADGYEIQAIATEPLVTSPVAIEWDAEGYLFVCEMRGYSEDREAGISRITRLRDTNDDGLFDERTIYADGLLWPTALFPFDGGLFVADAPNLYYFKDTDNDGVADQKTVALTGFSTSNVQGLLNSLRWGLDNRIHLACGTVGGKVRRASDPESAAVEVRGRDLAFNPWTYEFERTSGGAQHGMSFDDWGRKFASSNSDHIQQIMYEDRYIARNPYLRAPSSRLSIAADGPQAEVFRDSPIEPWRIVRTRLRVNGTVRGVVEGGGRAAGYFTGATGVTIYRGDAFPDDMKGVAIVGDVGSNLVHRKTIEGNGVPRLAKRIDEQSEFVTSEDIWFRPAQFANAPDGSLILIDVSREVIEHPLSLPPEIKKHLDLTAGRESGRLYRVIPDGFKHRPTPNMRKATTAQLVQWLDHPNSWHRETASRMLFERQDPSAVPALRKLAKDAVLPQGRLHALASLDGMKALQDSDLIPRLQDSNPHVRRHAIRLSESSFDSEAVRNAVLNMVQDEDIEVRYQLAWSLGYVPAPQRTEALAKLAKRDCSSRWMRAAVLSSVGDDADDLLLALLKDDSFRSPAAIQFLQELTPLVGPLSGVESALAAVSELPESEAAFVVPVMGQLLRGQTTKATTPESVAQQKKFRQSMDRMIVGLIAKASDPQTPLKERVAAIDACRYGAFDSVEDGFVDWLDTQQPDAVQRQALTVMGQFNNSEVSDIVLDAWPQLTPGLRVVASEILFARPERTLALLDAIDAGEIQPSAIGKSRFQVAEKSKDAKVRSRVTELLKQFGSQKRQAVIDRYQDVLKMAGDPEKGREAFVKHCASCHKMDGVGHELGPSLAAIQTRGAETILVNVLDPNREVNPQFLNYVVLTQSGQAVTGMITAESATSVTVSRAAAAADTVLRNEIDTMQSTGMSLMPEGLEETIDQDTLANIIAYLMQPRTVTPASK